MERETSEERTRGRERERESSSFSLLPSFHFVSGDSVVYRLAATVGSHVRLLLLSSQPCPENRANEDDELTPSLSSSLFSPSSPLLPIHPSFPLSLALLLQERSLPKSDLIKINLTEACEQIAAAEPGGLGAFPTPSPSPSSSDLSSSESEEEEEEGKKRKAKKKPRKKKTVKRRKKKAGAREEEAGGEKVVIGLRLSASLLLGVCR